MRLFFLFLTVLLLAPISESKAAKGEFLAALDVFDLKLDVDTTLNINGETRFFSSRPNRHIGGRLMAHSGRAEGGSFYLGHFLGLMWGKSSFLLNWEEPGLQSFPPLDSSISTLAMPIGMDLNLRIAGFLTISPYASIKAMWLHMDLEINNEDFKGNLLKLGLDAGCKVSLDFGKLQIAAGAGLTYIVNSETEFDIDDLNFDSEVTGNSPEYFLGVVF